MDFFEDDSLEFYEGLLDSDAYLLRLDIERDKAMDEVKRCAEYLRAGAYIVGFENMSKSGVKVKEHIHAMFWSCSHTPKPDTIKHWRQRNLSKGSTCSFVLANDPFKGLMYTVKQMDILGVYGLEQEDIDKILIDSSEYNQSIRHQFRVSKEDLLTVYKSSLVDEPQYSSWNPYSREDIIIRLLRFYQKNRILPPNRNLMNQYVVYVQLQGDVGVAEIALLNYF